MNDIDEKEDFEVPEYLLNAKMDAVSDCKILYCGKNKPITESLIPFGWEHGNGWNSEVANLSYKLESLNLLFYPKYGIRIEAVQVKEKFGTLHFYYDVLSEPPKLMRFLPNLLEKMHLFITSHVDFGYKTVVDEKSHTKEEWEEITKEEYESKVFPEHVSNEYGWKFKEENGKYLRNRCIFCPTKWHSEITKNRILHNIDKLICFVKRKVDFRYSWKYSKKHYVIKNFVELLAEQYVNEAEKKCFGVCEECGRQIGNKWSKRCCTDGWIGYICEDCAKRLKRSYTDDDGVKYDSEGNAVNEAKGDKDNA